MAMIQKLVQLETSSSLGDREIRVIASDATPDRVGDIMEPSGCDISDYKNNPIVLIQHDPDQPAGRASVSVSKDRVAALIEFAPLGISKKADEWCGLAKAGIVKAVSVGFEAIKSEPIRGAGRRFTKWKLLELSLVSIPANPSALVIERSAPLARKAGRAALNPFGSPYPADPHGGATDWPVRSALDLWLKREWPGLSWNAAWERETELFNRLAPDARKRRKARKAATRQEWKDDRFEEQIEEFRARKMSSAEAAIARQKTIRELDGDVAVQPFRWDPRKSAAENIFWLREEQWRGRR